MNIDVKKLEDAFAISKNGIQAGNIDARITNKLFREAFRLKKEYNAGEEDAKDFVSVLICTIKAMARVERGSETIPLTRLLHLYGFRLLNQKVEGFCLKQTVFTGFQGSCLRTKLWENNYSRLCL